jgi:2,5-diketo-D-gluconate reductase A
MTPTVTLNDGSTIPQIGFGTLHVQPDRTASPENVDTTANIVRLAIEAGYRHIDTAQQYGTEKGIAKGIAEAGITRGELYLTSKLANANHRLDDVGRSFEQTLDNLGVDQLDLFLIHWPLPTLYDGDYLSTWHAITQLVADGRLRTAGVSNFLPHHLDRLVNETGIVPAVNQIEVHPHFANSAACEATTALGIAVEAWSPLGQGRELDDAVINRLAADHGITPAQVILAWHLRHGRIIIPKTTHPARMKQNLNIVDLELADDEIDAIDALDQGEAGRVGPHPDTFDWMP